ncbi:MAG TPA: cysteine dioxygenase family protein [Pyrinomonadaceae bacterium]|jgi:cysteine dioxygenase
MSTSVTNRQGLSAPIEHERDRLTFQALAQTLKALSQPPALRDLDDWLRRVQLTAEDLRPYRSFKPGTYARHRVVRSEYAELLILCWHPGQRTPIHDHNGSYGAVRVCEGVMWETMFELGEGRRLFYKSGRDWTSGLVTGADVPDIHQLGNPEVSGQDLVTLHLYAPPLGVLNTYKVGSSDVGHYTPDEFMDGAGI